jgi:hypothetical protein
MVYFRSLLGQVFNLMAIVGQVSNLTDFAIVCLRSSSWALHVRLKT